MSTFKFEVTLPLVLEYNGVKLDLEAMDESEISNVISYLLPYGYGKSLQDAVAGRKKELVDAGKSEDDVLETLQAEMTERAVAIVAGQVGLRGPRLSSAETVRNQVIDFFFRAWVKKQGEIGKKLPRVAAKASDAEKKIVAEKIATIRQKYAVANEAKIEAEVARRMATQTDLTDGDIDIEL